MKSPAPIRISGDDRATLETLARRDDRTGLRAQAVLALSTGASISGAARSLRLAEKTVRAAGRRFLEGGAAAIRERREARAPRFPDLRVCVPAEIATWKETHAHGRPPLARRKIETWVRDCAALGLLPAGGRLPDREWFRERFKTGPGVVQDAFDELAAQGFVRAVRRGGTFLESPLPFSGRYLLGLLPLRVDATREGLDSALEAAARRQEKRLGVAWDIVEIVPPWHPAYLPTFRDLQAQRYAGALLRTATRRMEEPGRSTWLASLDHVPVFALGGVSREQTASLGSHAVVADHFPEDDLGALFRAVRAAGCRRAFVLGVVVTSAPAISREREDAVHREAAAAGVEIPPCFYQCAATSTPLQTRRLADLAFSGRDAERIDAVVSLQDNFAPVLCDALVARFGAAAARRRVRVFSMGFIPRKKPCAIPVEWHGTDWDATLDAFVSWCDSIHCGAPSPAPPLIVRR